MVGVSMSDQGAEPDGNRRRLFLGSAGLGALPAWLAPLPPAARSAVLVPTASNPMPAATWVTAMVRVLESAGVTVDRLDLERATERDVEPALRGAGLVVVTGGYPLFLLQHVRRTGFDRLIAPAVHRGALRYVGISAGAILAGPDLDYLREPEFDDPEEPGDVATTTGLGLVPFTVLPHRDRGRADRHDRLAARHGDDPARWLSLNDDQAVIVDGDTRAVVPSPVT
jgi:dipeptidase E